VARRPANEAHAVSPPSGGRALSHRLLRGFFGHGQLTMTDGNMTSAPTLDVPSSGGESEPTSHDPNVRSVEVTVGGDRRGSTFLRRPMVGGLAVPAFGILLFVIFSLIAPDTFFTGSNFRVIVAGQGSTVLMAMAIIVPLRAGDFDLSPPAIMVASGCTVGVLFSHGWSSPLACLVAIAIGVATGILNAVLVVYFGMDSFIATLGSLTILSGYALLITASNITTTFPHFLVSLGSQSIASIPAVVWIGWLVAAVLWYVFDFTPMGRYLLFIGGNRSSAYLAGVRVSAYRIGGFVFSGTLGGVSGLLLAATLGAIDPSTGMSYLLPPITAVFLGASAIQLGRINIPGTLVATYLLSIGIVGLELLGLTGWITDTFNGACLIVAVLFGRLVQSGRTK
jgi:ribose transport system permease protein